MSISKKKNSPYWYTRFSICGVRVQESTKTTSRAEAQLYEEKRRQDIRGQFLLGKKPSVIWFQAEKRWLIEMSHKRSINNDVSHFEWLSSRIGNYRLEDITGNIIESLAKEKEAKGVKPASVNRMLALVRSVLNRAYKKWEWINKVPVIQMRRENNSRIRWITRHEANKLLALLPRHLKAMAKFTLATGLRATNVRELQWSQIDMSRQHLIIHPEQNKTNRYLGVPLNQDAIEVLKDQIGKHTQFVFVFRDNHIKQVNTKAWRGALKKAGIENFRWHDLRHTWASWHVQNGTTLQELCELGGWSNLQMVLRYAHLSSNQLKQAADRITGAKLVKGDLKVVGS